MLEGRVISGFWLQAAVQNNDARRQLQIFQLPQALFRTFRFEGIIWALAVEGV